MLLGESGRGSKPKLPAGGPLEAFVAELREATRSVRTNRRSEILDAELAQAAIAICQAEAASLARGRRVDI
jgi:hypothetical protein